MNFDADYGRQYEKLSGRVIPGYDLLFQLAKGFLESLLPAQAQILVVGAGGGTEIVTFGSVNPGWHFVGVDPAAQMITFAHEKVERHGLQERVQLIQGYAQDLPVDLRADAATCILVLPFVKGDEAKLSLLREVLARMKAGAPLIIVAACDESFRDDFRAVWRMFQVENGASPEAAKTAEANVRATIEPIAVQRLLELVEQAGFTDAVPFYRALWFAGWFVWKKEN